MTCTALLCVVSLRHNGKCVLLSTDLQAQGLCRSRHCQPATHCLRMTLSHRRHSTESSRHWRPATLPCWTQAVEEVTTGLPRRIRLPWWTRAVEEVLAAGHCRT